ncbi:MAG: hypothetical protein ACRDRC_01735 [Pseudonocardiaceae bacterium]
MGTEHTLATVTDAGIYVLRADINALTAGDIVELRVYAKARNATDPERLIHGPAVYGPVPPTSKLTDSIPVVSGGHLKVTVKQVAGTGRVFPWVVLSTGA